MLTKQELDLIYEALMSSLTELTTLESDIDDYVASGHLIEQLEEAIAIVRRSKD
jgi:hypothetical protein